MIFYLLNLSTYKFTLFVYIATIFQSNSFLFIVLCSFEYVKFDVFKKKLCIKILRPLYFPSIHFFYLAPDIAAVGNSSKLFSMDERFEPITYPIRVKATRRLKENIN